MDNDHSISIQGLACSIFKNDLEALRNRGQIDMPFDYIDSMLHVYPARLEETLQAKIKQYRHKRILLLYGDCQPWMEDLCRQCLVKRTEGCNCCEIILGRERYRHYHSQGGFFLLYEWAIRWQETFERYLGLNQTNATDFMRDIHTRLFYVNTGVMPVPHDHLKAVCDYCGLPCQIIEHHLEPLLSAIEEARRQCL